MNELSIVKSDEKWHVFDKRSGQTVGALVARDFQSIDAAVDWCCKNYGLSRDQFKRPDERNDINRSN